MSKTGIENAINGTNTNSITKALGNLSIDHHHHRHNHHNRNDVNHTSPLSSISSTSASSMREPKTLLTVNDKSITPDNTTTTTTTKKQLPAKTTATSATTTTTTTNKEYIKPQTIYKSNNDNKQIITTNELSGDGINDEKNIKGVKDNEKTDGGNSNSNSNSNCNNNHLVYYKGNLYSATIDALIQHMVPTSDYYPEEKFLFSFLLTSRLFIRPHELLMHISQIWERQQQQQQQQQQQEDVVVITRNEDTVDDAQQVNTAAINSSGTTTTNLPTFCTPQLLSKLNSGVMTGITKIGSGLYNNLLNNETKATTMSSIAVAVPPVIPQRTPKQKSAENCIRLLYEWISTFPYDFRDERLMHQVRILARRCVFIDNSLGKQVSQILQLLLQRLTALEKYEEFLQSLANNDYIHYTSTPATTITTTTTTQTTTAGTAQHQNHNHQQQQLNYLASSSSASSASSSASSCNPSSTTLSVQKESLLSTMSSTIAAPHNQCSSSSSSSFSSTSCFHNPTAATTTGTSATNSSYKLSLLSSSIAPSLSSPFDMQSHHHHHHHHHHTQESVIGLLDLGISCSQLAHQLTSIELERLSHIGLEEFVQTFSKDYQQQQQQQTTIVNKTANVTTTTTTAGNSNKNNSCSSILTNSNSNSIQNETKKTRNLESYIEWFNRLSYLTASEIVKYQKKKQRVRMIEYWIETARECFNIGNFNSLMAIIAGLNLAPISRLKKTWSKVNLAKFSVLEHQMDPTSNFNSYRSTLKAAMWRSEGATNERERIIIPFFSLFVKDLYFLNESCSSRLPGNHINFEKCSQLAKQVMEFNEWKKVKCPFEKLPNVIKYLQCIIVLNENTLSIASFECEPPENTEEKGHYKTVKAETKQQLLQQYQEQQQQLQLQQQQQQHQHQL